MIKQLVFFFFYTSILVADPKSVIFDFNGVLLQEPNREEVVHILSESTLLPESLLTRIISDRKKITELNKKEGESWIRFIVTLAKYIPDSWMESFKEPAKAALGVDTRMYALVDELKEKGFSVGLLSNIDGRLASMIEKLDLYKPFDPCLLSYQFDVEKPDPKIYEILLDTLNLKPEEVVFVDDVLENVEGALSLGIDAILFSSYENLIKELEKRNIL